jgi:hypothetical protein
VCVVAAGVVVAVGGVCGVGVGVAPRVGFVAAGCFAVVVAPVVLVVVLVVVGGVVVAPAVGLSGLPRTSMLHRHGPASQRASGAG